MRTREHYHIGEYLARLMHLVQYSYTKENFLHKGRHCYIYEKSTGIKQDYIGTRIGTIEAQGPLLNRRIPGPLYAPRAPFLHKGSTPAQRKILPRGRILHKGDRRNVPAQRKILPRGGILHKGADFKP